MNVVQLLDEATLRIATALGLEKREARLEARVLACHSWGVDAAWLIAHDTDTLSDIQITTFRNLLLQRLDGQPIAHLVGTREFYGRPFLVSPDVLIPRPDTELLVELALARIPSDQVIDVLDLGTGSGCIAITLSLERPLARVTAIDRSETALSIAQRNADILSAHVEFLISDWFSALGERHFDLIVSNPPYIPQADPHLARGDVRFEPSLALVSGPNGLDALRILTQTAPLHLRTDGWLMFEHGWDQAEPVHELMAQYGFMYVECLRDLAGHNRVTLGQWTPTYDHS